MKNFNTMADEYHTSQSNLMAPAEGPAVAGQQRLLHGQPGGGQHDEMSQDLNYLSREAPLDGGESTFGAYSQLGAGRDESVLHMGSDLDEDERQRLDSPMPAGYTHSEQVLNQLSPDNVDIQRPLQQAGSEPPLEASRQDERGDQRGVEQQQQESTLPLKLFLVSFMVDARGGAMRGCRHSGVRVIIPPYSAPMPMRITCRYLRRERLVHPPPLMEGEACASKIMEVGPAGAKFLGPVLIEVPHFASLRGKEREIIILRSDNGQVWREHLVEADERLVDSIIRSAADDPRAQSPASTSGAEQENQPPSSSYGASGASAPGGDSKRRLTRIVTNEFPQYFAIISRIRQEVHAVGPEGSAVSSQVVPRVQAIFTEGALTRRIKIGLQQKGTKQDASSREQHHFQQNGHNGTATDRSPSPGEQQLDSLSSHERAVSSGSAGDGKSARPSSVAKRRSRFLACFGASKGSADLLEGGAESSGGDSPRQPANEARCKKRYILGDVSDSESSSLSGGVERAARSKRAADSALGAELVPDDYYIEQEPPLILNVEPTTYGKRLASSSAQTDAKLNGYHMALSTRKKPPRGGGGGGGGLCRGRRKHKTEMTIHCEAPATRRAKSTEPAARAADSSLDTVSGDQQTNGRSGATADGDDASLIQDVFTSEDQKWRTCTIQTDSDSVTVNYVTIAGSDAANAAAAAAASSGAVKSSADAATGTHSGPTSGQDDGYVSGSGDLNKGGAFGKGGLFGLPCGGATGDQGSDSSSDNEPSISTASAKAKARKQKAAAAKKTKAKKPVGSVSTGTDAAAGADAGGLDSALVAESPEPAGAAAADEKHIETADVRDLERRQPSSQLAGEAAPARSASPSKELKQKQKLERQERLKREKEQKRAQKELEEAAAKAEKAKKRLEKEQRKAEKAAQKSSARQKSPGASPDAGESPAALLAPGETTEPSARAAPAKGTSSVTFASTLVDERAAPPPEAHLAAPGQPDSIQRVVEETSDSYERQKARLSQTDGQELLDVSIGEQDSGPAAPAEARLISFSSPESSGGAQLAVVESSKVERRLSDDGLTVTETITETTTTASQQLKPILKQQSSVASGALEAEAAGVAPAGAGAAAAPSDAALAARGGSRSPGSQKSLSKREAAKLGREEKERAKREAKLRQEQQAEQLKRLKEAKRLEQAEAKRLAREAKAAAAEAAKAAKANEKRLQMELKLAKKQKSEEAKAQSGQASAPIAAELETATSAPHQLGRSSSASEQQSSSTTAPTTPKALDSEQRQPQEPRTVPAATTAERDASDDPASSAQATASKSSRGGFFSRLFGSRSPSESGDQKPQREKANKSKKAKQSKTQDPSEPEVAKLAGATTTLSSAGNRSASLAGQGDRQQQQQGAAEEKPVIMSEMYPSDPDDADGEMILEVNVPKNLIETAERRQSQAQHEGGAPTGGDYSQASESVASPTMATTIEESLLSSDERQGDLAQPQVHKETTRTITSETSVSTPLGGGYVDQEETLVNVSQMHEGDDDDEATENALSQAHDIVTLDAPAGDPIREEHEPEEQRQEKVVLATLDTPVGGPSGPGAVVAQPEDAQVDDKISKKPTKAELKQEKAKQQLAAKLQREAKKRAKEEEAKARLQAKRLAKYEKERLKREAKETARLAKLAKKAHKEEADKAKAAAGVATSTVVTSVEETEATAIKQVVEGQREPSEAGQLAQPTEPKSEGAAVVAPADEGVSKAELKKREKEAKKRAKREAEQAKKQAKRADKERKEQAKLAKRLAKNNKGEQSASVVITGSALERAQDAATGDQQPAEVDGEQVDTSNMTPVNTETEVQQIVEEVVGEDGVVTKTTKTIETKYVTMRQEEIKTSERRDMSLEEYERMKRERGSSSSLSSLSSSQHIDVVGLDGDEPRAAKREHRVKVKRSTETQQEPVANDPSASTSGVRRIAVPTYEHAELDEIRSTPSYFAAPREQLQLAGDESPRKEMKVRIKLNQKLIKRAFKLAKYETKRAKKLARAAESEIANCDEAARRANKQLKHAIKEAKRAAKLAAKEHKKMDKVDKKLAKRQKKIEKKQRKLDKRSAKLDEKAIKKQEKLAKKEAKKLAKQSSSSSSSSASLKRQQSYSSKSGATSASASRKSIKLEDIGEPVLRSSSRDLADQGISRQPFGDLSNAMVSQTSETITEAVIEHAPRLSGQQSQVDLSLDVDMSQAPAAEVVETETTTTTATTGGEAGQAGLH